MEKTIEIPAPPARQSDRDLSVGLRRSVYFHIGITAFILIKTLVFPGNPMPYTPTLRVDIVGLPDLLKKDLSDAAKLPPPPGGASDPLKEAEQKARDLKQDLSKAKPPKVFPTKTNPVDQAEPDEMLLKPKKASERDKTKNQAAKEILEKLKDKQREKKNLSALARIKALAHIDSSDSPTKSKTHPHGQIIKGNAISRGTTLSGDAKEAAQENYFDQLRDQLQENWALPVWIARQNLSARVQIFIDAYGRLRSFKLIKPSGSPQFDEAVKRALQDSQPFPAPPEGIAASVLADGILIGFPL